jgi:hypothetical protein
MKFLRFLLWASRWWLRGKHKGRLGGKGLDAEGRAALLLVLQNIPVPPPEERGHRIDGDEWLAGFNTGLSRAIRAVKWY